MDMKEHQVAKALGWFSIGLGLAEIVAPRQLGRAIGLSNDHSTLLRVFGAREIVAGVGLLTQEDQAPHLWARVAGDALDLTTLGIALSNDENDRGRLAFATAAVAGVTALDILYAQRLMMKHATPHTHKKKEPAGHFTRVITINRSPEDLYSFWRNFENLPQVMFHLVSVKSAADGKRSRWVAKAPAGGTVEWDAEIINEHPNELIAWRSLPGSDVEQAGTVRFEACRNGRGTMVKVEMKYTPPGGFLGRMFAKMFGESPEQQIADDLRHFKQLMETGEIPTIEGQSAGRRTSTSKRYDHGLKQLANA